jgi:hypothetical protein
VDVDKVQQLVYHIIGPVFASPNTLGTVVRRFAAEFVNAVAGSPDDEQHGN